MARLQQARPEEPPIALVVLRWEEPNAMVLFAHRIYISTAILDALTDDDALAFVLAHEIAHIDLGHIRMDRELTARLPPLPPMLPLRMGVGLLARAWMRPEMESEADARGQVLAVSAGSRRDGFEAVFDVLKAHAMESGMAAHIEADPSRWSEYWRQKTTGYPAIEERRSQLRANV